MKALFLLILAAASLNAADVPKADARGIGEMIRELSSESFQIREKATTGLWEAGTDAVESLREASRSDDPETAIRAAGVLEKIEMRITPETPEEILEQIRGYRNASQVRKLNIINELKGRKAYFQVLKLFASETDAEAKDALTPAIRGVALTGARDAISKGEMDGALELIGMSAMEPNDLMALASVHRNMGRLGDIPAPDHVPTDLWKITLLRADGDIAAAAKLADESGRVALAAGLHVLGGDPELWLRHNGGQDSDMRALDGYVKIALARWQGGKPKESDYGALVAMVASKDEEVKVQAMASLSALGRLSEAEKAQEKDDAELAFQYYLSRERVDDALKVLGLDPANPDYPAWVSRRFRALAGDGPDRDGRVESPDDELRMLASFMETRGMRAEFDAAFAKPLEDLAKEGEDTFLDFLQPMFQPLGGAPEFAFACGAVWAGDDQRKWERLIGTALGEAEDVMEWLAWIRVIEPGISGADTMRTMMVLFGLGTDPGRLRAKWMGKAWAAVDKSPAEERPPLILRIMALAIAMSDVENAIKARDMLGQEERDSSSWASIDKYLSAVGRWKEASEILTDRKKTVSVSPEYHALLAATLRKAGFADKAAEHDAWVEKLALGYAPSCHRIGDHYMYGGDPVRAAEWYRRAAFQADISGGEFVAVLDSYANSMLGEGRYEIAASCFEALAQAYVSRRYSGGQLSIYSKVRLYADLAKALAVLSKDRARAIAMLDGVHQISATDGLLADDFFPLVKKAGLDAELERWFADSWGKMSAVLKRFPDCDNSKNTAAWLASRAGKKLDEAEKHLRTALAKNPEQAAYLDTMAELRFAKGDRKGAVEWSTKALLRYPLTDSPYDVMIRRQHERFENAPLPR